MAAALAEERGRHLAGQAEHRLIAAERGEHRRARVQYARTRHHAEHAGLAGGARVAIGHVAAGLLVPGADHFQLCLMKRIEQAVDLRAGQAEHSVDAVRHKSTDDSFAARCRCHEMIQTLPETIDAALKQLARATKCIGG